MATTGGARYTNDVSATIEVPCTKSKRPLQYVSPLFPNPERSVLENSKTQNKDNVTQCYECMKQAGIDIDDMNKTSQRMKLKIHGFCNTITPNLYDLLATFLTWLEYTNEPVKQNTRLGNIPSISTLSLRFTSASGMNEATVRTQPCTTTPGNQKGTYDQ
jgi:hypothetical protein